MRRRAQLIVTALAGAALLAPAQLPVAEASSSSSAPGARPSSARLASASTSEAARKAHRKKHKHKHKRHHKKNRARKVHKVILRRPARAVTSAAGLDNAVKVSWRAPVNATRYRVKWAFAPWGNWPAATRYTSWMPGTARSATKVMSTNAAHDSTMSALPYANPIFTQVQAANGIRLGSWSSWKATWPRVPRPASGDPVRFGTYNVMLAGRENWATRMPVIARNIAARHLGVVALQEVLSTDGSDVARQLTSLTGDTWKVAPVYRAEGRILYDSSLFTLQGSGTLNDFSPSGQTIKSYRTGDEIFLPWARLTAVGSNRSFLVVSIHFAPSNVTSGASAQGNRETGASARAVLAAMNNGLTTASEPAVIAGDFAGGYGRWGDPNPAQPTLVRAGWWDSMASLSRVNVAYSTVNKLVAETPANTLGGRADGIFLRGIHGTSQYVNVANYFMPGTRKPPSDHNLVYSAFQVPTS